VRAREDGEATEQRTHNPTCSSSVAVVARIAITNRDHVETEDHETPRDTLGVAGSSTGVNRSLWR
jgi:hypothetical protein